MLSHIELNFVYLLLLVEPTRIAKLIAIFSKSETLPFSEAIFIFHVTRLYQIQQTVRPRRADLKTPNNVAF